MGGEIIEIETICAITNADGESEELVVLKDGGVSGFLGSLGETSVARGALTQYGQNLKGLWGKGREWMRICYERKRDLPHCGSPRRRMILVVGLSIENVQ